VICVDNDEREVEMLRSGEVLIYEPGLEQLVQRSLSANRLAFTDSIQVGVETLAIKVTGVLVTAPQERQTATRASVVLPPPKAGDDCRLHHGEAGRQTDPGRNGRTSPSRP
jgi:UDP-glucose 6-dehydrogenase